MDQTLLLVERGFTILFLDELPFKSGLNIAPLRIGFMCDRVFFVLRPVKECENDRQDSYSY